jgi:hypothetical protein
MVIEFKTQPAPTIPDHIAEALAEMSPEVFLVWNPRMYERKDKVLSDGSHPWEGRWEIWIELTHSTHEDANNELAETDRWNSDKQCWMRRLQAYETEDKEYASLDWGLIIGLEMADTRKNRRFYEDHIEDAWEAELDRAERTRANTWAGVANYYKNHNNVSVGRHFSSGWRHGVS